jgi:large subunit ribosomal protein L17
MRHRSSVNHLGRTASHRTAMERNLANALIEHERIVTTLAKAKNVKGFIERLVTLGKESNVHNQRLAFSRLRDRDNVDKLFRTLGPRFSARPGGYCRILKLNKPRLGDNGARAVLEFVERTPKEEPVEAAPAKAASAKPAKPAKAAPAEAKAAKAKSAKK